MKLLPDEEKILSSNADKIILTNHRIQLSDNIWGYSFTICIFLENISSIEIKYKSYSLFIYLGTIFLFLGPIEFCFKYDISKLFIKFLVACVFYAIWWYTRRKIVSISSNGGSALNFLVQGMSNDTIHNFIHKVSAAKHNRINKLYKL